MGLNETRAHGEDSLAVLISRARAYSQAADEAAQEYNDRSEGIARDIRGREQYKREVNEREMAILLKQEKDKDLVLDGIGRRQEFNAREAVRLYTMFQAEVTYTQLRRAAYADIYGMLRDGQSPTGRIPHPR